MIISQHPVRVPSIDENFNENKTYQNDIANVARTKAVLNYLLSVILACGNVEIKDFENVEKKLLKIIRDGKDKIHLISDFDMTITKYWYNGSRSPSSHDILTRSSKVSENYRKRCDDLKAKFYPIEISPELTNEEKFPYMVEWWENADQAILDEKIHKDTIAEMVRETPVVYRQGIKDVLYSCKEKKIPFLVFSAGVQNVIQETLHQSNLLFDNMNVVSNKMAFNEETGICDRFVGPLFHVLNKDNFGLEGTPYEKLLENRSNVIICGDSLGDIKMADGVEHETCLSIGFLNLNKEKMIEKYKNTFDIVITDDGSFDLVNEILRILI
ncbi:5'-nucleotidase, cytosolic III [Neocallimastix lanati (nom. inval.)]|jgi:5'-nucleotidase|uniref:5'-nucleotidase n=1 Tax=Neocallimastix californiae TaxID=1754190 RepID=A0A1Y2FB68_9FUNG|nr:5'-nucleotidase, cytosolic III [Neocallimastix sp. JGI-2020a]ORY80105.1 5'-nucleotidase, cytosolic III [Neocallimastix californiae]|eukprot:ORY80105.1 5'-nucleotidase, cytosolic III [Neocallimastix californiae]